ncbi:hypothetical protein K3U94_22295 [Mycolicibacter heraklionensis]|uniref:PE-PGRS family protein n=1 Tax=Mycolicibacter heraklionensis TaxID=512402 RepID=A0A9X7WGT4_9MYCO|nr:hypothetical protein [Mycolicibacter heraklionensis]QZA07607.1 hypothetical protein K3U94_22295 [Mycolicibacter heraklionensis]
MQQTLRPYVTTGLAVAGVGLVAVPPVASHLPQLQHQIAATERLDVALTDFFSPYTDLFQHTAANLQALNQNSVDMWGLLQHIFENPQQAISGIPDVINIFTNAMPSIDVQAFPFPAQIDIELPLWINQLLAGIGPWVTLGNAFQQVLDDIFGNLLTDPLKSFEALFGAPATLLDAFLNGTSSVSFSGITLPLFNGILTPGQPIDANFNIGDVVDLSGMGDTTITELLSQAGIGDVPLETLIIDLLDGLGFGHLTPVDLLNDMGIGTQPLSDLLIGVFNEAGIGNPTIAELLESLGGIQPGDSVASLLIALLNETDIGNPSLSELVLSLVGGDDATVGGLIKDLLGASGNESLASLIDPSWTIGGLLTDSLGDPPLTDVFAQLGLGSITLGALPAMLGDYGDQTLVDLLNSGFLGPDITGSTPLTDVLLSMFPPGATLGDFIGDYGNTTLGDIFEAMPIGENTMGFPPDTPVTDIPVQSLLYTLPSPDPAYANLGDTPLGVLAPDQASLLEKAGNPTLGAVMGTNTVGETLQNLHMYDITVFQGLDAMGLSNYTLESLFDGLGNLTGNVTLEQFFDAWGFDPTLTELMTNAIAGLGLTDTTVLSLFEDWGMGSVSLSGLIDSLGLNDIYVQSIFNNLGLNNIDIDMFIDRLGLSSISIAGILSGLGLDNQSLDDFINSLLGGVSIDSILNGLGLDEVHLDQFITDLMTSVLGDPTLGTLLGWIGLDNYDLDTIVSNLGLDGTINSFLNDLGLGSLDINGLIDGLGLSDLGLLSVNGDFFGVASEWLNDIPNQIAAALGFYG